VVSRGFHVRRRLHQPIPHGVAPAAPYGPKSPAALPPILGVGVEGIVVARAHGNNKQSWQQLQKPKTRSVGSEAKRTLIGRRCSIDSAVPVPG
jgi:hypothetical protein